MFDFVLGLCCVINKVLSSPCSPHWFIYILPHFSFFLFIYYSLCSLQMYLNPLMVVCQWWHWMKQARSESLGADQHWDLVKWSLVTLCSTGEGEPPLTQLAQCPALVQPRTPSLTSILVQCMKWELHQWALLDWVDTAVEMGSKWLLTTVSKECNVAFLNVVTI